ncbi:metallophosphoesterase family protein [Celerinatantimonas sp. YJH-8]|uniref:metallophosphoesterase family protein n=1 Tax=Celerinatantimonas sp. YJH-8 TaxID=3228714 RepID=UPI0038C71797
MQIAVLSDIHSNVYALKAVLQDIKRRGADVVVNLGDILYGPIAPKASYELLMEHELVTIRGNQDRQIYEASGDAIEFNPTLQFILQDLGKAPLQWMRSLPATLVLDGDIFLCHGTPSDDQVYLLEDVVTGTPQLRSESSILQLLGEVTSAVVLCGHTHLPRTVYTSRQQLIVNPGSVGLPAYQDDFPCVHAMENFSSHASYSLLEASADGWNVAQLKVAYDVTSAVADARSRGRDDWGTFLATGRSYCGSAHL